MGLSARQLHELHDPANPPDRQYMGAPRPHVSMRPDHWTHAMHKLVAFLLTALVLLTFPAQAGTGYLPGSAGQTPPARMYVAGQIHATSAPRQRPRNSNPSGWFNRQQQARTAASGPFAQQRFGRVGQHAVPEHDAAFEREAQLRALTKDPRLGRSDRGWLHQEIHRVERNRERMPVATGSPEDTVRPPFGKTLVQHRGTRYPGTALQDIALEHLRTSHPAPASSGRSPGQATGSSTYR